ncbi:MAG: hypothetical protein AAF467_17615 [Actinomycetota bacterium]
MERWVGTRWQAAAKDERGETSVGSVLLFPVLLLGLFMVIQLLLGVYVRAVASAAATDAAVLTAQEGATAAQGSAYAQGFILDQAGGLVLPGELNVTVTKSDEFAEVTVTGQTRLLWFIRLDSSASAPVERFEPQVTP